MSTDFPEQNQPEQQKPPSPVRDGVGPDGAQFTAAAAARAPVEPAKAIPDNNAEMALIRRICDGEKELFYQLIQPYQKMVSVTAISMLKNDYDAEDVAQEALFRAFKNLARFRGECRFSTWLVQITINEARQRLRRQKRSSEQSLEAGQESDEGDYLPIDCADWREIPLESLQRKELRQALQRAIANLKPHYREVLILRDINQRSVAETAQILSITEASVKTRLLRARLQMRDALAPGFDGAWASGRMEFKRVRPF